MSAQQDVIVRVAEQEKDSDSAGNDAKNPSDPSPSQIKALSLPKSSGFEKQIKKEDDPEKRMWEPA